MPMEYSLYILKTFHASINNNFTKVYWRIVRRKDNYDKNGYQITENCVAITSYIVIEFSYGKLY